MNPPIITRFIISFKEHKWLTLTIFLFGIVISLVFLLKPKPRTPETKYRAKAQLTYSSPPPLFTNTGEQLQQEGRLVSIPFLLSPDLKKRISEKLQISNAELEEIIEDKLKINPPQEEDSQFISLEYINAVDPYEGATTLKIFMDEIIEESRLFNLAQLEQIIKALEQRVATTQGELAIAEQSLYELVRGEKLLASVEDENLFSDLIATQKKQEELELSLKEIEGEIDSISKQLGIEPREALRNSALSGDPILAKLKVDILELEYEIKSLEPDFYPNHPKIITLKNKLRAKEQIARQRALEVLGSNKNNRLTNELPSITNLDPLQQNLVNTLISLQAKRDGIKRQLNTLKSQENNLRQQYEKFPNRQLQKSRLTQEVKTLRNFYQIILIALVDARSAEPEITSSYTIFQPPIIEEVASPIIPSDNRFSILIAGLIISSLIPLGFIFILGIFDPRLHTSKELRELLLAKQIPFLGKIPRIDFFDLTRQTFPVILDFDSRYLSFYELVRSNLNIYAPDNNKIIVVTSVHDREGKSITTYNLAIASAHAGKRTLIIEADFRSRSKCSWLGVQPNLNNYSSEPLKYFSIIDEAICLVPAIANLYIIPNPGILDRVSATIESDEFKRLIQEAKNRFDLVIIDSTSVSEFNDTLLLESLTDGILLVTQPGIIKGKSFKDTLNRLTKANIPIVGVVINDLDLTLSLKESQSTETVSV